MATKKKKKLDFTVNIEAITLDDMAVLSGEFGTENPLKIIHEFLSRVVEENLSTLPFTALEEIMIAIGEAIGEASNPKDAEGKAS